MAVAGIGVSLVSLPRYHRVRIRRAPCVSPFAARPGGPHVYGFAVRPVVVAALVLALLAGCGGGGEGGTTLELGPTLPGFVFSDLSQIDPGSTIPTLFTCDGDNLSPGLAWEGVPERAAELALVVEDPDAPGGTFTHWLVFGIEPSDVLILPDTHSLPEGENDFGHERYDGPCPPEGEEHRYAFRLLALDAPLELEEGAGRAAFDEAVAPHVIAEARLTATYARG